MAQKCMDDCEHSLAVLSDDIGAKVNQYISRLQECSHTHWNISGSVIKKNISRICQDQVRLQEVCRGIESLMQENDPFSFIEVRVMMQLCRPSLVSGQQGPTRYTKLLVTSSRCKVQDAWEPWLTPQVPLPVFFHIVRLHSSVQLQSGCLEQRKRKRQDE